MPARAGARPKPVHKVKKHVAPPKPKPVFQPRLPIRAAFYYAWFPESWDQQGYTCGKNPRGAEPNTPTGCFTQYHPQFGLYDSGSPAVVRTHIREMQYAHIQAAIVSWWGRGKAVDERFPLLLKTADALRTNFRWAIYYEPEGIGDPTVAQIASDLAYIKTRYAKDPAYLKVNGRFVVFVYSPTDKTCALFDRWHAANAAVGNAAYINLDLTFDASQCSNPPDGTHLYGPAQPVRVTSDSYAISPGFYKANEPAPRLARDVARFTQNARDMVASHAPWQLIVSFNEWGEGTAIEPAAEWAAVPDGAYLDALHTVS